MGARSRKKKDKKKSGNPDRKIKAEAKAEAKPKDAPHRSGGAGTCPECKVVGGQHLVRCSMGRGNRTHQCGRCGSQHWQDGDLCMACQNKMTPQEIKNWDAIAKAKGKGSTKLEVVRGDKTSKGNGELLKPERQDPPKAMMLIDLCLFYLPGMDLDKIANEVEEALGTGGKLVPGRIASVEVIHVEDTEDAKERTKDKIDKPA